MAERLRIKFFVDNCVPDSVGRVLRDAGHDDEQQSQYLTGVTVRRTHPCRPLSSGALDAEWALYLIHE
jgi:hypothetical protein